MENKVVTLIVPQAPNRFAKREEWPRERVGRKIIQLNNKREISKREQKRYMLRGRGMTLTIWASTWSIRKQWSQRPALLEQQAAGA